MFTYRVHAATTEKELMNEHFQYPETALRVAKTLARKYGKTLAFANVDLMVGNVMQAVVMKYGPYAYLFTETFMAPEKYPNKLETLQNAA